MADDGSRMSGTGSAGHDALAPIIPVDLDVALRQIARVHPRAAGVTADFDHQTRSASRLPRTRPASATSYG
jgi:hypothetical protein